jgi:hypothetical protein
LRNSLEKPVKWFFRDLERCYPKLKPGENEKGQLRAVGRLKEGATIEQAQAETDLVASNLASQFPQMNKT